MKKIEVVAAIIIKDNKIYCARRANKGEVALKWEFPGGKIEEGEDPKDALIREIQEELNATIKVNSFFKTVKHQYESFFITMHSYLCSLDTGNLILSEHVEDKWLEIKDMDSLDWAPADIPIVNKIIATIQL